MYSRTRVSAGPEPSPRGFFYCLRRPDASRSVFFVSRQNNTTPFRHAEIIYNFSPKRVSRSIRRTCRYLARTRIRRRTASALFNDRDPAVFPSAFGRCLRRVPLPRPRVKRIFSTRRFRLLFTRRATIRENPRALSRVVNPKPPSPPPLSFRRARENGVPRTAEMFNTHTHISIKSLNSQTFFSKITLTDRRVY